MAKIILLGISGVALTTIGLTFRLDATSMGCYFLFVLVAALGIFLCFYSGKLFGSRR